MTQLEAALAADVPFVVALVDGQRCRLLRYQSGTLGGVSGPYDEVARAVDTDRELGGFDRFEDEALRRHLRRCAQAVAEQIQSLPGARLLVGGTDPLVAELHRHLPPPVQERLAGRLSVPVNAPGPELTAAVVELQRRLECRAEEEAVERLRQLSAAGTGGVTGLEPTLRALEARRVGALVVSRGFEAWGGRCPSCGWIGPALRLCPRCSTRLDEVDDVVEVAIDEALAQKADVVVCDRTELDQFGRIGAIVRFSTARREQP